MANFQLINMLKKSLERLQNKANPNGLAYRYDYVVDIVG